MQVERERVDRVAWSWRELFEPTYRYLVMVGRALLPGLAAPPRQAVVT